VNGFAGFAFASNTASISHLHIPSAAGEAFFAVSGVKVSLVRYLDLRKGEQVMSRQTVPQIGNNHVDIRLQRCS